jgi:hypothetical protein
VAGGEALAPQRAPEQGVGSPRRAQRKRDQFLVVESKQHASGSIFILDTLDMDPTPPEEHGGLDAPVEQPWEVLQRADLVGSQSIPSPLAPGPQGKGSAATVTGAPADAGNPHEELEPVEARGKDSAALARPPAAAPSAAAAPVAGPPPAEEDLAARIAQLQAELQASQCDLRLEKEKNLTLRRAAIVACSFWCAAAAVILSPEAEASLQCMHLLPCAKGCAALAAAMGSLTAAMCSLPFAAAL